MYVVHKVHNMCRLDLNTFKWGYENSEYFLRHLVGAYALCTTTFSNKFKPKSGIFVNLTPEDSGISQTDLILPKIQMWFGRCWKYFIWKCQKSGSSPNWDILALDLTMSDVISNVAKHFKNINIYKYLNVSIDNRP